MDERYDYRFSVRQDVRDYVRNNGFAITGDQDQGREDLYEQTWAEDSVTGNASGSYFCNAWRAGECLLGNWDLLVEACDAFGTDLGEAIRQGEEYCDVAIRCYVLREAVEAVIDELYEDREDDDQ